MKVALGQLHLHWEDKEANLRVVEAYLELLAENGTELFLLPEMSLTGFSMHTERIKEKSKETISLIRALCEKYRMAAEEKKKKASSAIASNCGPGSFGLLFMKKNEAVINFSEASKQHSS